MNQKNWLIEFVKDVFKIDKSALLIDKVTEKNKGEILAYTATGAKGEFIWQRGKEIHYGSYTGAGQYITDAEFSVEKTLVFNSEEEAKSKAMEIASTESLHDMLARDIGQIDFTNHSRDVKERNKPVKTITKEEVPKANPPATVPVTPSDQTLQKDKEKTIEKAKDEFITPPEKVVPKNDLGPTVKEVEKHTSLNIKADETDSNIKKIDELQSEIKKLLETKNDDDFKKAKELMAEKDKLMKEVYVVKDLSKSNASLDIQAKISPDAIKTAINAISKECNGLIVKIWVVSEKPPRFDFDVSDPGDNDENNMDAILEKAIDIMLINLRPYQLDREPLPEFKEDTKLPKDREIHTGDLIRVKNRKDLGESLYMVIDIKDDKIGITNSSAPSDYDTLQKPIWIDKKDVIKTNAKLRGSYGISKFADHTVKVTKTVTWKDKQNRVHTKVKETVKTVPDKKKDDIKDEVKEIDIPKEEIKEVGKNKEIVKEDKVIEKEESKKACYICNKEIAIDKDICEVCEKEEKATLENIK